MNKFHFRNMVNKINKGRKAHIKQLLHSYNFGKLELDQRQHVRSELKNYGVFISEVA